MGTKRRILTYDRSLLAPTRDFAGYYAPERIGKSRRVTQEGFLLCEATPLARIGTQTYAAGEVPAVEADRQGMIRVDRPAEEVFHTRALASLEGKPITIEHPPDGVSAATWKRLAVGHVQNVRRGAGAESDLVLGDLLITDPEAIEYVNQRLPQISVGYHADYEQTTAGRATQRNILGNHVALVERGRAGPRVSVRDSQFGVSMNTRYRTRDARVNAGAWDAELKPRVDSTISAIEAMLVVDPVPPILDPGQVWTGSLLRRFDQLTGATGDDKVDIGQVTRELEQLHAAMGTVPLDTRGILDSIRRIRKAADEACGSQQYGKEDNVKDALRHARGATNMRDHIRSLQAANNVFWRDQPTLIDRFEELPGRRALASAPPALGARPTIAEINAHNRAFWANR